MPCGGEKVFARTRSLFLLDFQEPLEFRDDLEILGATRSPFDLDESFQVDAQASQAEDFQFHNMGEQILIAPARGDFAQQVNVAK